jgi:hypothetical protein
MPGSYETLRDFFSSHLKRGELNMRSLVLSALLLVLLTPILFGQATSSLGGTVTDPSGGVVPGATITIVNTQTGIQRETTSNGEGVYNLPSVLPGIYNLTAKMTGFTAVEVKNITLDVNTPATVNVKFEKVGGVAETVTVEASATQINTTDASMGNTINATSINQLPSYARDVTNILLLQPGVTTGGNVNGGKSDQANVTLDGVDVNDQVNRTLTSILRVTLDSVQEFRTTTTGENADSGRGAGADVALVTKNGTNQIHGSAYEYNRNTMFAADSFFNNRGLKPLYDGSGPSYHQYCTAQQLAAEWSNCKAQNAALLINVFGGSIGGPIIKNKLFLFANYEGNRNASASNVTRTVPTDNLRNGIVTYKNAAGTLTTIGPADIKTYVDPLGIGADPASLRDFALYPQGNVAGTGDGLNTISYQFISPRHVKLDTYIARLDYTVDNAGKHQIMVRGNLDNDHSGGTPEFPGQLASGSTLANNKGLAAGYTWVLRPNMVNSLRYGFTRQGGESTGLLDSSYTYFRGYSTLYATSTPSTRFVPVHTIGEDFSWTKGGHDLRFGATVRVISNSSTSQPTFHSALTNASGLAGSGSEMYANIPGGIQSGSVQSYTYAMDALIGGISELDARYNYLAKPDGSATVIPVGGFVARDMKNQEYELYGQDSWKIRHNFTLTLGLRLSVMPPVYEANGQQVSPNVPLSTWLAERGYLAQQGLPQSQAPSIAFVLASSPEGRKMYPERNNLAPRLGMAWAPSGTDGLSKLLFGGPGKSSIRAGFGMYYDMVGQPLAATFSTSAFGLSSSLSNPLNILNLTTAPRYTGFVGVPGAPYLPSAPPAGFPVTYPNLFAITNSIDDQLQAPYTMNSNISWGREFSKGFFVQAAYVGRLSRHSLIQRDLAMPTNLRDPSSSQTYFQAMDALATYTDITDLASRSTSYTTIGPIPFFENMWPAAAGGGYTATQNIANYYVRNSNKGDFTNVLYGMDAICGGTAPTFSSKGVATKLPCSRVGQDSMFNGQFAALSGTSSIGSGAYHAAQLTVRKRFSDNLQFDINYTFSKSEDLGSGNENSASFGSGFITNTWDPHQNWAVSNYDSLQIINVYGVWRLPVGRGQMFGRQMNKFIDAFIGGWQLTGIWRQNSATTTSGGDGSVWATNWQLASSAVPLGTPMPAVSINKNGVMPNGTSYPEMFATQADANASIASFRQAFAGEEGGRNILRVNGYFDIDTGLFKEFKMPFKEGHTVQIRWESFNVTNSAIMSCGLGQLDNTGTWGQCTSQKTGTSGGTGARNMQFALRYTF